MYRIGTPFWRYAARFAARLRLRVDVQRDDRAGVYVATSGDLRGLVCEAAIMDKLMSEINSSVDELIAFHVGGLNRKPVMDLRLVA